MTRPFHQHCGKLVKCDECRFHDWADAVLIILENHGRVRGRKDGEDSVEFMQRCRSDEPFMCFDLGDEPLTYANHIMMEPEDDGGTGYMEEVEL